MYSGERPRRGREDRPWRDRRSRPLLRRPVGGPEACRPDAAARFRHQAGDNASAGYGEPCRRDRGGNRASRRVRARAVRIDREELGSAQGGPRLSRAGVAEPLASIPPAHVARKNVVEGKRVSVRVEPVGIHIITKKTRYGKEYDDH